MQKKLLIIGLIMALVLCFSGGVAAATGYETTGPELTFVQTPGDYNVYANTSFYTQVRVSGDVGIGDYFLITNTGIEDLTTENTGNYAGDYTTFDSQATSNTGWGFDSETNEYVFNIRMDVEEEDTWVALLYVDIDGEYAITDPWQLHALEFSDVPAMTWYKEALVMAVNFGVVNGYGDGSFHPQSQVTRAEFAQMLYNLLGGYYDIDATKKDASFSDVKADAWYYDAVTYLAQRGYLNGYNDGTFKPGGYITRAEIAQILYNIAIDSFKDTLNGGEQSYFIDVPLNAWYYTAVTTLADAGWVRGYADVQITVSQEGDENPMESHPYFQPENTATRAEALQFVTRLIYGNQGYEPNQPFDFNLDFVAIP